MKPWEGKKGAQRREAGPALKRPASGNSRQADRSTREIRRCGSVGVDLRRWLSGKTAPAGSRRRSGRKKQTPCRRGAGRGAGVQKRRCRIPAEAAGGERQPAGKGRFEIQAAAYREKQKAEQMVKKIQGSWIFAPGGDEGPPRQGEMVSRDRGWFRKPGKGAGGGRTRWPGRSAD